MGSSTVALGGVNTTDPVDTDLSRPRLTSSTRLRRDPVHKADRALHGDLMEARKGSLFLEEESDGAGSKEQLRGMLEKQLERLLRMDPFIGLKHAVKEGEWDLSSEDVRIGSFGLVYPSLKALNDVYLGPIDTDHFMEEIQRLISEKLSGDTSEKPIDIFYKNSKSGSFLLDLGKFASAYGIPKTDAIPKLKEVLKDLQTDITAELQRAIGNRMMELTSEQDAREARIRELNELGHEDLDAASEKSKLEEQLKGIRETKDNLGNLSLSLGGTHLEADGSATSVDITIEDLSLAEAGAHHASPGYMAHVSFCLNRPEIGDDPENPDNTALYLSLLNALRGVAMNALRTFKIPRNGGGSGRDVRASYAGDVASGEVATLQDEEVGTDSVGGDSVRNHGESMRSVVQEFNYVHFLMDLARARDSVLSKVLTVDEGGVSSIKPEWSAFFYLDENSNVRMKREMIMQYRKERLSREYAGALTDTKQRRVFAKYYDNVNVIDVLKNFRLDGEGHYKERVKGVLDLVDRIEKALGEDVGREVLRGLAREADSELGVFVKDEGEEVVRTVRSAITNLFCDGNRAMVFVDHIGFGGMNQASYEQVVIDLVDMLGITAEELEGIRALDTVSDPAQKAIKWNLLIRGKFEAIRKNPHSYQKFVHLLLSVGDEGTAHIRGVEGRLHALLGGIVADLKIAVGGDEATLFVKDIPDGTTPETFAKLFQGLSQECRLRVFGVLQGRDKLEDPVVVSRYVLARRRAEREHTEMKGMGDTAPVKVIDMPELILG